MSNVLAASGFTPVAHITGSEWNGKSNQYYVPSSDVSAYYLGDVVQSVAGASDGRIGDNVTIGVGSIVKCAAAATPRGVIVNLGHDANDLGRRYLPATKDRGYLVSVVDDPGVVFMLQGNNTNSVAATCIGQYADFAVGIPASNYGVSATTLDASTIADNAALPLRIVGLAKGDFTAYTNFLVVFNLHELG